MSSVGFGHRVCAGWVRWYTRRLPPDVAEERRDELMSDLWEHAAEAAQSGQSRVAHQLEVIGRMLSGMPADVSWRRGLLRSDPPQPAVVVSTVPSSQSEATMSKRWICRIVGHQYRRYPYPGSGDTGGHYLLCARCRRERDDTRTRPPPAAGITMF